MHFCLSFLSLDYSRELSTNRAKVEIKFLNQLLPCIFAMHCIQSTSFSIKTLIVTVMHSTRDILKLADM